MHTQVEVQEIGPSPFANRVSVGAHDLIADEPETMGGRDAGPSPYDYLMAALGSCTSMTLRMYANAKGWPLERVTVRLAHAKIHAKDCADCESASGKIDEITREIVLYGPGLTEDQRARLLDIADKCPVHRTLHGEIKIRTELR